jgi:uncharacterized RDD family membrane protein YckC
MGYAAFFKRVGAYVVDNFIVLAISLPLALLLGRNASGGGRQAYESLYGLYLVVGWLYFARQESSAQQATLGKKLFSIKVADSIGNRISFAKASGRFFSKILSGLLYGIGFLMAAWTQQRQALHDKMCDTLVVTAETEAAFFKNTTPEGSGGAAAAESKLEALEGLRQKGILSNQEFEESKKKLLASL